MPGARRRLLLPGDRAQPRVITAHYILPPEPPRAPAPRRPPGLRRDGRGDRPLRVRRRPPARGGRARPGTGQGDPPRGLRLPDQAPRAERRCPPELAEAEGPVILFFGLLRPYKGIDTLIEAFARIGGGAELWIVGNPRMPLAPLREAAARARAPSASSPASSTRPRSRSCSAAPTRRPALPRRPSTRASSTRRWPSASRWCCRRSAASPSSRASTAPRASSRPAIRPRWPRRSAELTSERGGEGGAGGGRRAAPARAPSPGTRSPRRPSQLYRELLARAAMIPALLESGLLGVGRPDRLHPRRLPPGAVADQPPARRPAPSPSPPRRRRSRASR